MTMPREVAAQGNSVVSNCMIELDEVGCMKNE